MLENFIFITLSFTSGMGTSLGLVFLINGLIAKSKSSKLLGLGLIVLFGLVLGAFTYWYYANP